MITNYSPYILKAKDVNDCPLLQHLIAISFVWISVSNVTQNVRAPATTSAGRTTPSSHSSRNQVALCTKGRYFKLLLGINNLAMADIEVSAFIPGWAVIPVPRNWSCQILLILFWINVQPRVLQTATQTIRLKTLSKQVVCLFWVWLSVEEMIAMRCKKELMTSPPNLVLASSWRKILSWQPVRASGVAMRCCPTNVHPLTSGWSYDFFVCFGSFG